ncbi:hypothetical protein M9H77_03628 [Catharanthus roseus]|uniref:Uncharacterized protein n=1 Tax=Catharanthus roseus TaxID=4058 RepID=A0ACC0CBV0_CATRO|nr:hypothetical protein M9H77_03628 [Catharanthus roseus]
MEQLLLSAIHNVLPRQVVAVLVELCSFFRLLCLKILSISNLEKLQDQIVLTLCHLEMLFSLSFFIVMVHLMVPLVDEAIKGEPVEYRWMFTIERLKSSCPVKAQPEASIAYGYVAEEALTFCSRYFTDIESRDHIKRRSKGRKPSATEVDKRIMNPDLENIESTDLKFLARGPML